MTSEIATGREQASLRAAVGSRRWMQVAVSVVLFAAVLVIVILQNDLAALPRAALDLSAAPISLALGALVLGILLAAVRVKLVAGDLGYALAWREAFSALGFGQLGGAVFFQLAGQLIARGSYLSRRGIPVGASVVMVGYERLLALGISLMLATIGAWYLFGRVAVDLDTGGSAMLKLVVGLLFAVGAGAWLGWGRAAVSWVGDILGANAGWRIARGTLLSLGIQLATASAYVIVAGTLAPDVPMTKLVAASFIVMLAASLPISLAGWGIREFSAVLALGAIGVPPPAALLTAMLIGIGALITVIPLAGLGLTGRGGVEPAAREVRRTPIDYNFLISLIVPLAAATAVFFQVYLPTKAGGLNVNLADPFAILGGVLFVIFCVGGRTGSPGWRLSHMNFHILASVVVMTAALLIGAARFGWTDWALVNKFAGWFVLLAYGSTGALIVTTMGARGLRLLLLTFIAAGASIAAVELVLLAVRGAGMELSHELLWSNPRGFSQNRNAFAFQLIMIICAVIALAPPRWLSTAALAIAVAAVWATASRAGLGALFIVLVLALYVRAISPKNLAMAVAGALGLVLAIFLAELLVIWQMTESFSPSLLNKALFPTIYLPGEEVERMRGIVGSMDLFRAHPLFGAGLGGFINSELGAGRAPLVIHSTPLWLLAETGLVGLVILSAPIFRVFWCEFRRDMPDNSAFLLMLIIAGFAVMSLVHEMLYQRTFWLLLGAALATPVVTRRSG